MATFNQGTQFLRERKDRVNQNRSFNEAWGQQWPRLTRVRNFYGTEKDRVNQNRSFNYKLVQKFIRKEAGSVKGKTAYYKPEIEEEIDRL